MNPQALLSAFLFSTSAISFVTAAITASTAVNLAPTLLDQLAGLEDALETIKTNQIVLAAIKLRSLIPDYVIEVRTDGDEEESSDDEDSSDDEKKPSAATAAPVKSDKSSKLSKSKSSDSGSSNDDSDSDSDSDSNVPTSHTILISSLTTLLKTIPSTSKSAALSQVASFDFAGPKSLDQFLAEKEAEAAQKLSESFAVIRQIQGPLNLRPKSSSSTLTPNVLAHIVAKLDALQDEYEEMEELQKRLKSSKPSKREKAQKAMPESQTKIAKIVQKLADILEVL